MVLVPGQFQAGPEKQVSLGFKSPCPSSWLRRPAVSHWRGARGPGPWGAASSPFDLFHGRISQRVELSRRQLQAIGERVSLAQAKIEKIKGSKKAIKVAPVAGGQSQKSHSLPPP